MVPARRPARRCLTWHRVSARSFAKEAVDVRCHAMVRPPKKTITELDELAYQILNLQALGRLYQEGVYPAYKLIAVVLRTLLIGSSGDAPFVRTCLPSASLPRLIVSGPHSQPSYLRVPAALMTGNSVFHAGCYLQNLDWHGMGFVEAVRVGPMFDPGMIPLEDWLNQEFLVHGLTLGKFIKLIAHKEGGAHIELTYPELSPLHACGFVHWPLIASLAEPVATALESQVLAANPGFMHAFP